MTHTAQQGVCPIVIVRLWLSSRESVEGARGRQNPSASRNRNCARWPKPSGRSQKKVVVVAESNSEDRLLAQLSVSRDRRDQAGKKLSRPLSSRIDVVDLLVQ